VQAGGGSPSSVTKTEFSTFTYFITSLSGLSTVTSTDIVISSNVIGRRFKARLEPVTPRLRPVFKQSYSLERFCYVLVYITVRLATAALQNGFIASKFSCMRKQILFKEEKTFIFLILS
jgi:hypothetical protein